jgi:predicted nuclease of predicted toxin-antitoxin system
VRFLVDMGLGVEVAAWLRSAGHDATHLRDESLQRLPDAEIADKARREGRVVLTCDLEFPRLFLFGDLRSGLILFRLARPSSRRVIGRLAMILSTEERALSQGAVIVVEDTRHRVGWLYERE